MAAVTELSFLLFALINNIDAEELIIIQEERGSYIFNPNKEADFCLISRFVGEEKLVLWNTSDLRSVNSTVAEDLKQRLSVVSRENISSYMIHSLTHSDSGQYQEECWTEGKGTYEKNLSIIICSTIDEIIFIPVGFEGTADLPCLGAADNLDIQWLKRDFRYKEDIWTRVLGDSRTSLMDNVTVMKNKAALHQSNLNLQIFTLYTCLVMNQQQCVSSHPLQFSLKPEIIYRSVEETAVLQCAVTDYNDDQPPRWTKFDSSTSFNTEVDQNYSLVFSSLMLNHSGLYSCKGYISVQTYFLLVCPKLVQPAVEFFSEGDEVTLRCRDWRQGMGHTWFMNSNRTEGRNFSVLDVMSHLSRVSIINPASTLVISNVSVEDTGEYWCAVIGPDDLCESTNKILLKHREPFGIYFYIVRWSLLSGLLVILCAVVVAVTQKTRRGGERPAETEG